MGETGSTWLLSHVEGALVYSKKRDARALNELDKQKIIIVGCGKAGGNTLSRLSSIDLKGAQTIAINTDEKNLDAIDADIKILIGESLDKDPEGHDFTEISKRAARLARGTLEEVLKDVDLVFVTAGMGGAVGSAISSVVADIAKKQGATVIGMVSSPLRMEGARRVVTAEEGIWELRKTADTVIVLDGNRVSEYAPGYLSLREIFSVMDQIIAGALKDITDTLTQYTLMFLDYADIKTVMGYGGIAVMLTGEVEYGDSDNIVGEVLTHPLLDVNYRGATGSFILITGGPDLTLKEAESIATSLKYSLNPRTKVIWGAKIERGYEGKVRVLAIMTGVRSAHIIGPNKTRTPMREADHKNKDRTSVIDIIPF